MTQNLSLKTFKRDLALKRHKDQDTEIRISDNLIVKIKSTIKHHSSKFKVKFLSINGENKTELSKIKLYLDLEKQKQKCDENKGIFVINELKEYSTKYVVKNYSKDDKEILLTLETTIFGLHFTINFKTDDDNLSIIVNSEEIVNSQFVSYVNFLNAWWPPEAVAASIGVPPYSHTYSYNKINLAFWTTNQGPVDAVLLWQNPLTYVSVDNPWGTTNAEIQQAWISLYHQYNVKILVSAFGATDFPTTQGADPIAVAEALAQFCKDNYLDGVDLDYEDNGAMEAGTGEPWLISCTQKLRELLPSPYIISHAPQAPYFMGTSKYPNGGYLKVNEDAGSDIDYYNIQFYNQDSSTYDTYESLFNVSNGWATNTAVKQIAVNVDKNKLVVGKGVKPEDFYNTGYVPVNDLASYLKQGVTDGYSAGFMGWQFSSDTTGSWSETLATSF